MFFATAQPVSLSGHYGEWRLAKALMRDLAENSISYGGIL
jgi:hypothetical protein